MIYILIVFSFAAAPHEQNHSHLDTTVMTFLSRDTCEAAAITTYQSPGVFSTDCKAIRLAAPSEKVD